MRPAIFFDRDGVLTDNSQHYYIWKSDQLTFVDGIFSNLKRLQEKGYLLFIVSNQGGISRGIYSRKDVDGLHAHILQQFNVHDITITEMVYCPHHPEFEKCLCRKPGSLMFEKLMAKYHIDPQQSFFIGDSESDMEAAKASGITGIRITPNESMEPYISTFFE